MVLIICNILYSIVVSFKDDMGKTITMVSEIILTVLQSGSFYGLQILFFGWLFLMKTVQTIVNMEVDDC